MLSTRRHADFAMGNFLLWNENVDKEIYSYLCTSEHSILLRCWRFHWMEIPSLFDYWQLILDIDITSMDSYYEIRISWDACWDSKWMRIVGSTFLGCLLRWNMRKLIDKRGSQTSTRDLPKSNFSSREEETKPGYFRVSHKHNKMRSSNYNLFSRLRHNAAKTTFV